MNRARIRLSVIIPVFNSEFTLQRTLDSLMAQTERNWEAIIVDDGSPDNSAKVAEGFAYFDPRFLLLRQQNAGAGAARNTALSGASGDFVMFLDADDWLEPTAFAKLLDAASRQSADLVHGAFRYTTNDGWLTDWVGAHRSPRPLFEALCGSNVLSMPAAVIARRTAILEVGGLDASFKNCGDWDLWGRLARRRGKVARIDDCVANYRMRPTSLSHNPRTLLRDANRALDRLHAADPRVPNPAPEFRDGAERAELPARRINFAVYTAGLALGAREPETAGAMLDGVDVWPEFSPAKAAGFLFSGICFAQCQGPEGAAEFWPGVEEGVRWLASTMDVRTGQRGAGERILQSLEQLMIAATPFARSA